ncbi:MAG: glycosyltransferase family 9 protein [Acidiferrobacter sp.]
MEALRDATRIVAVCLGNIRDVVMLSPALQCLHRAVPRAHLTLMVSQAGAAAAGLLPEVDEVCVYRAPWQDCCGGVAFDFAREDALVAGLRARQYDAAFLFTSVSESPFPIATLCYLAGIPVRVAQSRELGGGLLTHGVRPMADATHPIDRNLHLLREAGIPVGAGPTSPKLSLRPEAQARVDALLRERGVRGGFVVIAPGATCDARCYPLSCYQDVALRLQRTGHQVVVAGGAADRVAGELLSAAVPGVISLCGETSLAELAALLRRARLLIANHSGAMSIGDAVGCPMVILYSGTEPEEPWRPRVVPTRLLRRPTACSPCYRLECPYDHECLAIAPRDVVAEAMALLGESLREVALG